MLRAGRPPEFQRLKPDYIPFVTSQLFRPRAFLAGMEQVKRWLFLALLGENT